MYYQETLIVHTCKSVDHVQKEIWLDSARAGVWCLPKVSRHMWIAHKLRDAVAPKKPEWVSQLGSEQSNCKVARQT